jgi:hypothetical protein
MLSFCKGFILGCLLFPFFAKAETNVGASYLALCNKTWKCDESLKAFDGLDTIRVGWLAQSFGDECPCADKLLSDPRPKVVRIHLANSTCFRERGRVCGKQEVFHGESVRSADTKVREADPRLMSRFNYVAARARKLLQGRRNLKCYVSPCLECNLSVPARRTLIARSKRFFPQCEIVDNPADGPCVPGYLCEKHGPDASLRKPCGADLDGDDFQTLDVGAFKRKFKDCDYAFIWGRRMNCLRGTGFTDPRKRNCGDVPNRYFKAVGELLKH